MSEYFTNLMLNIYFLPPVRQFILPDTDIWFVRFSLDENKALIAAGNTLGRVYLFDPHALPPSTEKEQAVAVAEAAAAAAAIAAQTAMEVDGSAHAEGGGSAAAAAAAAAVGALPIPAMRSSSSSSSTSTSTSEPPPNVHKALCSISHPHARPTVRDTAFAPDGNTLIFVCDDATVIRCDRARPRGPPTGSPTGPTKSG